MRAAIAEQQTGVAWATLKKHYAKSIPDQGRDAFEVMSGGRGLRSLSESPRDDATSLTHNGNGDWNVTFGVDVSQCSYQVTPSIGVPTALSVVANVEPLDPHSVRVFTGDPAGQVLQQFDAPFYLTVMCLT